MFDPELQRCDKYGVDILNDTPSVRLLEWSAGDK